MAKDKQADNIFIHDYIEKMPEVLSEIELVVGRSGATSLAEITALGRASILIPSPNVTADHQTKNAVSLVKNKAAKLIAEKNLNGASLFETINDLMTNEEKRREMAQRSKSLGRVNASDNLIELMLSLVKKQINESE